jgi:transposase
MEKQDARKLSPEQQETLRLTAVRMVELEGYSQRETARAIGVTRPEVNKWCRKYHKGGWDALKAQKRGRRPGDQAALKPHQCATIVRLLTDNMPDQLKLPFVLWTRAAVRDLVEDRFGVCLSLVTMGNYLRSWGFTAQKPTRRAYAQDAGAVQRWRQEEYPAIAARAKRERATIFWGDEGKVTNQIHAGRSYARRGQTPVVKESGKRLKLNHISAVTNRGEMRFMTYTSRMTQTKYILFLARLVKSSEKKVFFIADNLSVHHGKRVRAWAEEHADQIELFFIPSYAPETNPDEYLNRDLKKNVHGKRAPKTFAELKANVLSFMKMLQKTPSRVAQYFNGRDVAYCAQSVG